MSLNFTTDIMDTFFASNIATDANYESPGNFNLPAAGSGSAAIDHVTIGTAGDYTTIPTATPALGTATFQTAMKLLSTSVLGAAGAGYSVADVLTMVGGVHSGAAASLNVAHTQLVSVAANALGTGYSMGDVITLVGTGGTTVTPPTVTVDTIGGGGSIASFHISTAGEFSGNPTAFAQSGAAVPPGGTGATFQTPLYGVKTFTVAVPSSYTTLPAGTAATTVSPSGGTGCTITGHWGVTALNITDAGAYETTPTIAFSSGIAAATAVLGSFPSGSTDEHKLYMLVELIRSYLDEATNTAQVKDMHSVVRKMLAALHYGGTTGSFDSSDLATKALNAGMRYIASNPKHNSSSI